jgi:hypothetical protein
MPVLAVRASDGGSLLAMRLCATPELMARPESVLAALYGGAEPATITRTALVFDTASPALDAWRRKGRFE